MPREHRKAFLIAFTKQEQFLGLSRTIFRALYQTKNDFLIMKEIVSWEFLVCAIMFFILMCAQNIKAPDSPGIAYDQVGVEAYM